MILIISQETEVSTEDVIEWLLFNKASWKRINGEKTIQSVALEFGGGCLGKQAHWWNADGETSFSEIHAVWYRRGDLNIQSTQLNEEYEGMQQINAYHRKETLAFRLALHQALSDKYCIGSIFENYLSKISILEKAIAAGFSVPATLITTSKKELLKFLTQTGAQVVTKSIDHVLSFWIQSSNYYAHTSLIDQEALNLMPPAFNATLFQERIPKKYELRVFYLDQAVFCAAIFSQHDPRTQIDFRNYNYERPNRVTPYRLPDTITAQITGLMRKMEMRSGSLDLIVTPNDEYIFLEVNPVGQFKQVSDPCNYYIEKKIADTLTHADRT